MLAFAPVMPYVAVTVPSKAFDYSDLYLSKDALDDIRNWGVDTIDEQTRREIYSGHCQSVNIPPGFTGFTRADLHELGKKGPYHRVVSFPIK